MWILSLFLYPVLKRVTATLKNTTIRLEHLIPGSDRGIATIIKIDSLKYYNEAGSDPSEQSASTPDADNTPPAAFSIASYATHHFTIDGVSFFTEEFRIVDEEVGDVLVSPDLLPGNPDLSETYNFTQWFQPTIFKSMGISEDQFHSTMSELPEVNVEKYEVPRIEDDVSENESQSDENEERPPAMHSSEPVMFGQLTGKQTIILKIKVSCFNKPCNTIYYSLSDFLYFCCTSIIQ